MDSLKEQPVCIRLYSNLDKKVQRPIIYILLYWMKNRKGWHVGKHDSFTVKLSMKVPLAASVTYENVDIIKTNCQWRSCKGRRDIALRAGISLCFEHGTSIDVYWKHKNTENRCPTSHQICALVFVWLATSFYECCQLSQEKVTKCGFMIMILKHSNSHRNAGVGKLRLSGGMEPTKGIHTAL